MSKYEAQKRIEHLAQDFASATPPRVVAHGADGSIDIEGDDGKHARLSADGAGILIEFLVDTYSEGEGNLVTEALIAPRLATEASSDGDVIVIVSDYLGTPGPPTRLPPDPAR